MKVDVEIDIFDVLYNLTTKEQVKLVKDLDLNWDDLFNTNNILKDFDESELLDYISDDALFEEVARRSPLGRVLE